MAPPGARQAHAQLNQLLPALLIAEIEGDDLPGYDLCARIKSTSCIEQVPVVLTTRSGYRNDYANAQSLGGAVCLAKPFRMEQIGHAVGLLISAGNARKLTAVASAGNTNRQPRNGQKDSGDPTSHLKR
jgi:DNA-binding response OmpR family regulator